MTGAFCELLSEVERRSGRAHEIVVTMPGDQLLATAQAIDASIGSRLYDDPRGIVEDGFLFLGIPFKPRAREPNEGIVFGP